MEELISAFDKKTKSENDLLTSELLKDTNIAPQFQYVNPEYYNSLADNPSGVERIGDGLIDSTILPVIERMLVRATPELVGISYSVTVKHNLGKTYEAFVRARRAGEEEYWACLPCSFSGVFLFSGATQIALIDDEKIVIGCENSDPIELEILFLDFSIRV